MNPSILWSLICGILALLGVLALARRTSRGRSVGVLFVLTGILLAVYGRQFLPHSPSTPPIPVVPPPGAHGKQLTVSFIDVGQGDASLVQFPSGETMLIDAGDRAHGETVVRYLRTRGVTRLDYLVATHPHEDHIGGMATVLAAFPVGRVWDSGYAHGSRTQQEFLRTIKAKGLRYGTPRAGLSQTLGAVQLNVLAPATLLSGTESDANNNSLVLRIIYGKMGILFTGDMEKDERDRVAHWPGTQVLKVAHHGSYTGTDGAFARQVRPRIAVISVARDNEYGHPHATALRALRSVNADIHTTSQEGTLVITTDGSQVSIRSERRAQQSPVAERKAPVSTSPVMPSYIGNKRSKVFHRPTCSNLPATKQRVVFPSRTAARNAGYHPCGECHP